jgi:DNA-binding CsgD family transcriptional regulator
MDAFVSARLSGDELRVYRLLAKGYPPERIAGKLGMVVSRVRYIIYEKIQPSARRYV